METTSYIDGNGDRIEIGSIVGFSEFFTNHQINPQNPAECYKVVALPNSGDMVQMVAGSWEAGETEGDGQFVPMWGDGDEADDYTLTVEPWKIGLI